MIFNTGLDICLYVPGMPIGRKEWAREAPLGGSETAGMEMARSLARRGHKVVLFCNTKEMGDYDGVSLEDLGNEPGDMFGVGHRFQKFLSCAPVDVLVAQRTPVVMSHQTRIRRHWLWMHDLCGRQYAADVNAVLWNVDSIVTVSEWMKKHYVDATGMDPDYIFASRNALAMDLVDQTWSKEIKRDHRLVLYAARPERGLDILLGEVMPRLLAKVPGLRLAFCSYADAFNQQMGQIYQQIYAMAQVFGAAARRRAPMPKMDLYELHRKATLYLYPTNFSEVSCISAMECMALGNVFVSSALAALPETVPNDCGVLIGPGEMGIPPEEAGIGRRGLLPFEIDAIARHPRFIELFVEKAAWLLTDPAGIDERERISARAREHARKLSWDAVAGEWENELERQFRRATSYAPRVARHFLAEGDVVSAKRVLDEELDRADPAAADIAARVDAKWALADPDKAAAHYGMIGSPVPNVAYHAWKEPRFHHLVQWLAGHPEVKDLLDVGCAHGGYSVGCAKQLPALLRVVGVDVSAKCIEAAHGFAIMELPPGERHRAVFHVEHFGKESDLRRHSLSGEGFDAVVAFEFVEHTSDPAGTIEALERQARPGGWVLITIPFGSFEPEAERLNGIPGCHLSSLDVHDLRDMMGDKPGFHMVTLAGGNSPWDDLPNGWLFVQFMADGKPLKERDWERKRRLQRPRQGLGLSMITSNAEAMLRRTLRSVAPFVDQIVIGDHGSTDSTRAILSACRAKILNGPDPLSVGFDEARNFTLPHIHMDWVLWIDSDEEMLDGFRMLKFLRNSQHRGFSIHQHHFSAIPPNAFRPDIPVRLFRLREEDGSPISIRWFGHIHEHPETALNASAGRTSVIPDAHISHDGYTSENKRRARFDRNFLMVLRDREKYPERLLGKFFELRDCIHLVRYVREKPDLLLNPSIAVYINGLAPSPGMDNAANRLLQHAIRIGQGFLAHESFIQREALDYYGEAVQLMGGGFRAFFGADVLSNGANGPAPEAAITGWFASQEDYERFASGQMKQRLRVLADKY